MAKLQVKENLANIITSTRIISTLVVAFSEIFSTTFFVAYTYAGISDALDGFVARHTNTVSHFGKRLDSVADLFFFIVMMLKMLPLLSEYLPAAIMKSIYAIAAIRLLTYLYCGVFKHTFLSNHTILNKATGFTLFFLPYVIRTSYLVAYSIVVCSIAFLGDLLEIKLLLDENKKDS